MAKNQNTALWVIGIVVVLLVMAQFGMGEGVFAIAGGGAGSSVSNIYEGFEIETPGDTYYVCVARPPVGETWLITGFWDYSDDCGIVKGELAEGYPLGIEGSVRFSANEFPDRLFIDHDAYLVCGLYWGDNCEKMGITGVRV